MPKLQKVGVFGAKKFVDQKLMHFYLSVSIGYLFGYLSTCKNSESGLIKYYHHA